MANTLISKLAEMDSEKTKIKHKNMEEKEIIADIINGRENPAFKNMVITIKHNGGDPSKAVSDVFAKHPSTLAVELLANNDAETVMACTKFLTEKRDQCADLIYRVCISAPTTYDDKDPMISIFSFQAKTFVHQYDDYMEALSIYKTLKDMREKQTFNHIQESNRTSMTEISEESATLLYDLFDIVNHKIEKTIEHMKSIYDLYKTIGNGVIIDFGSAITSHFTPSIINVDDKFFGIRYLRIKLPDNNNENPKSIDAVLNLYCVGYLLSSGFEVLYQNGSVQAIICNN